MRTNLFALLLGVLGTGTRADCFHPNGLIETDAYHAPCSEVLDNPLNKMCCAINRKTPSEGISANGYSADLCLPNGLCKQNWCRYTLSGPIWIVPGGNVACTLPEERIAD